MNTRNVRDAVAVVGLTVGLYACAAFQKLEPLIPTPDQVACIELEADKHTPAPTIIVKCGLASDALAFIENFLVGHKQAKSARAAAAAAELGQ